MPFADPEKKRRYMKKYQRTWYQKNKVTRRKRVANRKKEIRQWFNELKKGVVCSVCEFSGQTSPWAIEFHHHEPKEKTEIVSYLVAHGYSRERILNEVEKCDPICANCHRQQHYEDHTLNPDDSIWTKAGQAGGKELDPEKNSLSKRKAARREQRGSIRRRGGRDPNRIPGPNPTSKEE